LLPASSSSKEDLNQATVVLNSGGPPLAGAGSLLLRGLNHADHIALEAEPHGHTVSVIWVGGNGRAGDIVILPASATSRDMKQAVIHINGKAGDITLQNADCAEEFDVNDASIIDPGTVMVADESGVLSPCRSRYDSRVVGVVSGAGDTKPAIVLGKRTTDSGRLPIALVGKVRCKVDAAYGPISVGDLLTTSDTAGHAMKALDPQRAFGAVLGKALGALQGGASVIPALVALQ
jgi:hypothetical protein